VPRRLPSPIRPFEMVPTQLVVVAKRLFSVWRVLNSTVRTGEEAGATSEPYRERHADLQPFETT
jgi:hypothetical protein